MPTGNEDLEEQALQEEEAEKLRFASYAVLDLETSNLPSYNFNKVAITELSLYGFDAKELERAEKAAISPPATPRVLHKLTLLLNPRMRVHDESEQLTGLNNYMLEEESPFNENAAKTVLGFLQHLKQPVCLVAHNGISFDFPIFKQPFDKLKMSLPFETLCLDSLRAFHEIDTQRALTPTPHTIEPALECETESPLVTETCEDAFSANSKTDWRLINETTPKRPPTMSGVAAISKRKLLADIFAEQESGIKRLAPDTSTTTPACSKFHSRRALFNKTTPQSGHGRQRRVFPPKGVYKLASMYERIFNQPPIDAHHAEADVEMLMRLMLHYGQDFNAYAWERAIPFAEVGLVGTNN